MRRAKFAGIMAQQPQKTLSERRRERLGALLAQAEREGARWQFWVTFGAIGLIAAVFVSLEKWDAALLYQLGCLAVFVLTNLVNYALVRRGIRSPWVGFVLGSANIAFLTYLVIVPNPFSGYHLPVAMGLREAGFKYVLIFVCLSALNLSPRLAAGLGLVTALCWIAAVLWVVSQHGTIVAAGVSDGGSVTDRLRIYFEPNYVDLFAQATNVAVILIIAGIIAAVVARSRKLADDYTRAERARINLSRHFSPNVVTELAANDEPFGPVRRQDIAVLFADIVGFTNYSEDHRPEEVFQMLRDFHRRMEAVVFDNGGTVDNYIGDCIMATFGVPQPRPDDAARALRCARAMQVEVAAWNGERRRAGLEPVDVRIGMHFGPVVLGAIGSERNLSIAVVGDTCNVASRLQALCRELDASICAGADLVARVDPATDSDALAGLVDVGAVHLRGRDNPVGAWILPRMAAYGTGVCAPAPAASA